MKNLLEIVFLSILCISCQREKITIGTNVSETFYLDNNGSSMRILVEGNTASHTFLIFIHGGPGTGSFFYNTEYISQNIEDKCAAVYWDQRNAGASQGNINGKFLNLSQMTDDLKKVILVIKSRYGQNSSIFILGHSFGGLLASSFMTTNDNQSMVKGWIFADGSHNYPLNDSLTRQMLLTVGQQQIALNKHVDEWSEIVTYCNTHASNYTLPESDQLETYALQAETYFDEVKKIGISDFEKLAIKDDWPITSILFNYLYTENADINKELAVTEFSSSMYKVVTPTLLLFGKYDFICPKEMGDDIIKHINTSDVRMAISPISGHLIMFQDEAFFCNEVNDFIELHQ
jgi:proline iminopeptidase